MATTQQFQNTASTVANWQFNSPTPLINSQGDASYDLSVGTVSSTTGYTGVTANGAYSFTGAGIAGGLDVTTVPSAEWLSPTSTVFPTNNFTIETWVKSKGSSTDGAGIITKYYSGGGRSFYVSLNGTNLDIAFFGLSNVFIPTLQVALGWRYIAVTFEGNASANIYVDGALVHTTSLTLGSIENNSSKIVIGNYQLGSNTSVNADIDSIRISNVVLSQSEIYNYYNDISTKNPSRNFDNKVIRM